MTMNPLPPQAYTKETLVKAYQWLQNQSDSIKEMATQPDILVSLFLKAKLQGDSALERPSIVNFKNELRNLAGMMGEFEIVEPSVGSGSAPSAQPSPAPKSHSMPHASFSSQSFAAASSRPLTPPMAPQAPAPVASLATRNTLGDLDARSLALIQEVKNQLNLGSELEALRVLISIGHCKIKFMMNDK